MRDMHSLFKALSKSRFRSRFKLGEREQTDLDRHGLEVIRSHAERFIHERLAPATPSNDGKQTPMRNHPVFIAQHATATCCRGCLAKWHGITAQHDLSEQEQSYVCDVIMAWLEAHHNPAKVKASPQHELF